MEASFAPSKAPMCSGCPFLGIILDVGFLYLSDSDGFASDEVGEPETANRYAIAQVPSR